jgi:hypothetical protein
MKPNNRWGHAPHSGPDKYFFDDGVDVRKPSGGSSRAHSALHDDGLCSQVFESLSLVFGGTSSDQRLWAIGLLSVEPAPSSSRLLIKVYPLPTALQPQSVSEIQAVLKAARPFLRREIGQEICRRKIPELTFEVVPGPRGGDDDDQ